MKLLASNLKPGVPMDKALDVMVANAKSRSIRRTVSVISGAIRIGGRMEEVLTILSGYLLNFPYLYSHERFFT